MADSTLSEHIDGKHLTAYILWKMGWTQTQLAQVYAVAPNTVWRWIEQIRNSDLAEVVNLPTQRLATDVLLGMVPQALRVYAAILDKGEDHPKAMETATKILNTFKIVRERHEHEVTDLTDATDDELIAEAEGIISSTKGKTGEDQSRSEEA